ncbi:MAG: glycosyltransferase, partial [Labilithrix sp.]|nr:glycosyltransferase [Labilithrix sp.]
MPRVSITIPAYNHERFVGRTIESVLAQTFTDWELIICDDASADRTLDVIARYEDPRIRVIRNEVNLGASMAARKCCEMMTGEFRAPLSSDDVWHPEKLAKQVAFMDSHPEVIAVFSPPEFIDEEDNILCTPPPPYGT